MFPVGSQDMVLAGVQGTCPVGSESDLGGRNHKNHNNFSCLKSSLGVSCENGANDHDDRMYVAAF